MVPLALSRFAARRRGRRMLVVAVWAPGLAVLCIRAASATDAAKIAASVFLLVGGCAFALLAGSLNLTRGPLDRPLDERERAERDAAYYTAFRVSSRAMLLLLIYAILADNLGVLWLPSTPRAAVSSLLAVGIAFGALPVTVLGWTAADSMLDDDDEVPVLAIRTPVEPWKRRVMFALAVCAATAAGLGAAGVVPALAKQQALLAGLATGLGVGAVVLTRRVNGTRG
ncbi:MAG: hypothetical protein JWM27_2277 [Gemmatimonadetes bacterium]|nr:hypothetical protein [Gemmatimonadota bacterium]